MTSIFGDWKEEYLKKDNTYQNHVTKFVTYLSLPSVQKDNEPANITTDDIDSCVGYYAGRKQINSVKSMESHLESIKAFYNYLIKKKYWNKNIIEDVGYDDFKKSLIIKYNLIQPMPRDAIDDDEIKMILDRLDEVLKNVNFHELGAKKQEQFLNRLVLRIYIKLCLIAPAKKAVLLSLKYSDFEESLRVINVNKVRIRIPNSLHQNIADTIKLFENIKRTEIKAEDGVFEFLTDISKKSNIDTKLNGWFYTFLKEYNFMDVSEEKTTYPIEIINNTAIYNLVKQGTNAVYISKISGVTIATLEDKFYKRETANVDEVINFAIAKSNYYNYI